MDSKSPLKRKRVDENEDDADVSLENANKKQKTVENETNEPNIENEQKIAIISEEANNEIQDENPEEEEEGNSKFVIITAEEANKQVEKTEEEIKYKQDEDKSENIIEPTSKFTSRESCLHDVALPPNYKGEDPLTEIQKQIDREPAKKYPFKLDAFQSESVQCIEHFHSVLVSAHTSAGKTAVAEYAIASALRDNARVIYTSPIKALSNQKYRELADEFKDVGLMTGDVTIQPNASCLVMTTEILRSMLFRGSEILNEVKWVIFDEVHYMRDLARGVVWEETIILLPNTVRFVFLSATIPNAKEFAGWVARLKGHPVHVVYTEYRPTPLQHYFYPSGGNGIHLIVDEKGKFRRDNFQVCMEQLSGGGASSGKKGAGPPAPSSSGNQAPNDQQDVLTIMKLIIQKNLEPVVLFNFSRKKCESLAVQLTALDMTNEQEKSLIEEIFTNAITHLSDDDKKLPQVEQMLPLLKKGVGIHHSGLLPMIKEVVELLFQEGLIKALFATETFAMGLNMPARTVVFTSLTKFDGEKVRLVGSGEYIQMSGRAGRRGKDDRGIVIVLLNKDVTKSVQSFGESTARKLMTGTADPLNSSFFLSYFMVLNLLRVDEISPEYIMERSFLQFQSEKERPKLQRILNKKLILKKFLEEYIFDKENNDEKSLNLLHTYRTFLEKFRAAMSAIISSPEYALPFLQRGRIVKIADWSFLSDNNVIVPNDEDEAFEYFERKLSEFGFYDESEENPETDFKPFPDRPKDEKEKIAKKFLKAISKQSREDDKGFLESPIPFSVVELYEKDDPERGTKLKELLLEAKKNFGWGVILNYTNKKTGKNSINKEEKLKLDASDILVEILLPKFHSSLIENEFGSQIEDNGEDFVIVQVELSLISDISQVSITVGKNVDSDSGKQILKERFDETFKKFPNGLPLIDPITGMGIKNEKLPEFIKKIEKLEQDMMQHPLIVKLLGEKTDKTEEKSKKKKEKHTNKEEKPLSKVLEEKYMMFAFKRRLESIINDNEQKVKNVGQMALQEDLKKMLVVLRKLQFVDQQDVMQTKGRVAAEISAGDELVCTEFLFSGVFNDLTPPEVAGICSTFVVQTRGSGKKLSEKQKQASDSLMKKLPKNLQNGYKKLQEVSKKIGEAKDEAKMEIDVAEYSSSFAPDLMGVVHSWCLGAPFVEICKETEEFEGSIVTNMRRLEELLRQFCVASKIIGDDALEKKFVQSIKLLKRDIVFSSSLYL